VNLGAQKSKRAPREAFYMRGDRLTWYAVGDGLGVSRLLADIDHVGNSRGVGSGRVREWEVDEIEAWEPGFPVLLAGRPLRSLPLDWPGVDQSKARVEARVLQPPYWHRRAERQIECWVGS